VTRSLTFARPPADGPDEPHRENCAASPLLAAGGRVVDPDLFTFKQPAVAVPVRWMSRLAVARRHRLVSVAAVVVSRNSPEPIHG